MCLEWSRTLNTCRVSLLVLETPYENDEGYGNEIKLMEWLESKSESELLEDKEYKEKMIRCRN